MSAQEGVAWGGGGSLQFEWYLCQHAQRGCRAVFRRQRGGEEVEAGSGWERDVLFMMIMSFICSCRNKFQPNAIYPYWVSPSGDTESTYDDCLSTDRD